MTRKCMWVLLTLVLWSGLGGAQGLPSGLPVGPGLPVPPSLSPAELERILREHSGPEQGQVPPPAPGAPLPPPPVEAAPPPRAEAPSAPKQDAVEPAKPEEAAEASDPGAPAAPSPRDVLGEIRQASRERPQGDLPIFGFNLFEGASPFQPVQGVAVPDDYVVGPGDTLRVTVWGRFDADYLLTVDNEGRVLFPKVGPVQLGGLTYIRARERLKSTAESITGVSASVTLGTTRTIQVFVVGEARQPGTHTLGPFSTVIHAVLAAGGPTPLGSLRQVELRRAGRAVAALDLYGFILRGEIEGDRPLDNGDVVVISRAATHVWLFGRVKRPAVYELRPGEGLRDLLAYAGGLQPDAYGGRIQVERAEGNRSRVVLDVPLDEIRTDFTLQDGDSVRVFPLRPEIENRVALYGHVFRPDTYAFRPGMRVSDLIRSFDALKPEAELSYAVVLREEGPDRVRRTIPFDLGSALQTPGSGADLALQPKDEIYVFSRYQFRPPLRAEAQGEVRNPGLLRFERGARVSDLVRLAGGLTAEALLARAELLRFLPDRTRSLHHVDLGRALGGDKEHDLVLEDEDVLVVHSLKESVPERVVRAEGQVHRPGTYPLTAGMRVSELVFKAGELTKDAHLAEAHLFRLHPVSKEISFHAVDLRGALEGRPEADLLLQDMDRLVIYSAHDLVIPRTVSVAGEVKSPATYPLGEGMRVADLVLKANGLTRDAHQGEAHLFRTDPESKEVTIHVFHLGRALSGDPADNLLLRDEDRVVVHSAYEYSPRQKVYASGYVNQPGEYPYAVNMRVRDLVLAAAGLKEEAYLAEAEVVRSEVVEGETMEVATLRFSLADALAGDPGANLLLRPHDKLFVKRIREWRETARIELAGEVQFPGTYFVSKGERLSSVLERAGGLTANAYPPGAVFTRESAREQQQRRLDELRERLEQAVLRIGAAEVQGALSAEDVAAQRQYLEAQQALVRKLQAVRATGRVVVRVQSPEALRGTPWDLAVEDGDTLTVPKTPQTVAVVGQVYNPTSLVWEPEGRTVEHYLAKTGGPTPDADAKEIYVVRADGTVMSRGSNAAYSWWSRGILGLEVHPGDTVLVPEKVLRVSYMKELKDITQILFQVAVTAGVAVALF